MADSDLVTIDYPADYPAESPVYGSTPAETFRATFPGCTPEGELSTVIVTRQGLGSNGRVWLTFNGAIRTTVVMTDGETGQLVELLDSATALGRARRGRLHDQ